MNVKHYYQIIKPVLHIMFVLNVLYSGNKIQCLVGSTVYVLSLKVLC